MKHPSTHDILRDRLLSRCGLQELPQPKHSFEELQRTEWSPTFEQLMRNRLIMGALRYGTLEEKRHRPVPYDLIGAIKSKIELYDRTGNLEYMVDIANYCLLEFELGDHPTRHFEALDNHHNHCKYKQQ